jgi:hypothetical protein
MFRWITLPLRIRPQGPVSSFPKKHQRGRGTGLGSIQRHPQESQHALPRSPSTPSLTMIGTITSAATGSAHHHPSRALRSRPPRRIAERYVQKSACLASAFMAPLSMPNATFRLALASSGMTNRAVAAMTIPSTLASGASWRMRDAVEWHNCRPAAGTPWSTLFARSFSAAVPAG